MDLQKIGVKLYASDGDRPPLQDFVPVLHRWIQESKLEGTLIDVVDYRHVQRGPGVMLVGSDFHVSLGDDGGGRGISVDWKRPLEGDSARRIGRVLALALDAAIALEAEALAGNPVRFDGRRLDLRAGDRILTPNDDATWASFRTVVEDAIGPLIPASRMSLDRHPDGRRPLTARFAVAPAFDLRTVRDRLAATS